MISRKRRKEMERFSPEQFKKPLIIGIPLILVFIIIIVTLVFASSGGDDESSMISGSNRNDAGQVVEDVPAVLSFSEGEVSIQRDDEWIDGEQGVELFAGDLVQVEDGTVATISYFEGSFSELEGPCEIRILKSQKAVGSIGTDTNIEMQLDVGKVFSKVSKLASSNSSYRVKTANVIAGSWGTEFTVILPQRDGLAEVIVSEGLVCVTWLEAAEDGTLIEKAKLLEDGESFSVPILSPEVQDQIRPEVWDQIIQHAESAVANNAIVAGGGEQPLGTFELKDNNSVSYMGIDSDSDGVFNVSDACPDDASKVSPGICGCGTPDIDNDSDNDGTLDCLDDCPNDPRKTGPGNCGCGIAETDLDSDGDGTFDCNDKCPTDSNKTVAGACGCGKTDVDSDSDGTLDCLDTCPNDPSKYEPGLGGCGNPEPVAAPTPTTTPVAASSLVEDVLMSVLPDLIVAFSDVNGQWHGYKGTNTLAMETLQSGQVYWFYAVAGVTPDWAALPIAEGWNQVVFMSETAQVATALQGYENSVLFVINGDIRTDRYLYRSSVVVPLTEILYGQNYCTFIASPGDMFGTRTCQTR